jgi:hypothetical protein
MKNYSYVKRPPVVLRGNGDVWPRPPCLVLKCTAIHVAASIGSGTAQRARIDDRECDARRRRSIAMVRNYLSAAPLAFREVRLTPSASGVRPYHRGLEAAAAATGEAGA